MLRLPFGLPLPLLLLSLALAIALCVHAVRTGQQMYWLWIILAFQPIGGLVYFVAVLLPGLGAGPVARRMGQVTRRTLDPGRALRDARAAYEDAPTVHNAIKFAEASGELGQWSQSERLYAAAAQGLYAEDPALLLGRARALVELGRSAEARPVLDNLAAQGNPPPEVDLLRARAAEAVGEMAEAERAYQRAVERMPGLEAIARQAAFLAGAGRREAAQELLREIELRTQRTRGQFRVEARQWRDLARQAIA